MKLFFQCCIDVPIGGHLIPLLDILMVKVNLSIWFTIILLIIICVLNFQMKNEIALWIYFFLRHFQIFKEGQFGQSLVSQTLFKLFETSLKLGSIFTQLGECGWTLWLLQPYFEDETHTPGNRTWKFVRTPKISEFDCRGQNTSHCDVLYIIRKLLKRRCWKWARMSHLDICSTSYGKKKGRKSNCQFDSRPLKVGNWPDPGVCRWSATHHWKTLNKNYKFAW